jgi:hypothetical protein
VTDAVYDPATNPRYLKTVADDEPTAVDAQTWADLHTDLATAGDILETLGTRGWSHVAERIKRQMATAERVTTTGDTLADIHRAQGAIRACEWLLGLNGQMQRERERLTAAIANSQLVDE